MADRREGPDGASREADRREASEGASGEERPASRETRAGSDRRKRSASGEADREFWFLPLILFGGMVFGFGLGLSQMARPEVVLNFLQFEDFGLVFVMGGAAVVTGLTFAVATQYLDIAPLTGRAYTRRLKEFDRNVLVGGGIFGVGWGLSGICPGAAYASLGIGNLPILWGIAGMFLGAYAQGLWRTQRSKSASGAVGAD